MPDQTYGQFCPVAMAAELLCTRWTIVLMRELLAGSTRFNELRRGLPRISPALLSQRLKELEAAGVVERHASDKEAGVAEYFLTPMGRELEPVVMGIGRWGQRWIRSEVSLQQLDGALLMWDVRRNLTITQPPPVRKVVKVKFPDAPPKDRDWWLLLTPDCSVDLCKVDPGHDVDLYVTSKLEAMTKVWMGLLPFSAAVSSEQILITGDQRLAAAFPTWLGLSPFATVERKTA